MMNSWIEPTLSRKASSKQVFCFGWTDLILGDRSLMLRLGISFFLFGLINNGMFLVLSPKILTESF